MLAGITGCEAGGLDTSTQTPCATLRKGWGMLDNAAQGPQDTLHPGPYSQVEDVGGQLHSLFWATRTARPAPHLGLASNLPPQGRKRNPLPSPQKALGNREDRSRQDLAKSQKWRQSTTRSPLPPTEPRRGGPPPFFAETLDLAGEEVDHVGHNPGLQGDHRLDPLLLRAGTILLGNTALKPVLEREWQHHDVRGGGLGQAELTSKRRAAVSKRKGVRRGGVARGRRGGD